MVQYREWRKTLTVGTGARRKYRKLLKRLSTTSGRYGCAVGVNIGNEIDGTGELHDRPVLVLRAFNAETFFGVCLIGHPRTGKYYFPLGTIGDRDATANLSQIRLFDSKRFIRKIATLDEKTFQELAKKLTVVLFPFLPLK